MSFIDVASGPEFPNTKVTTLEGHQSEVSYIAKYRVCFMMNGIRRFQSYDRNSIDYNLFLSYKMKPVSYTIGTILVPWAQHSRKVLNRAGMAALKPTAL